MWRRKSADLCIAEILLNRKVQEDGVLVFDHGLAFIGR